MTYNIFPTFSGRGWNIKKRPYWNTLLKEAASGAQYATQLMQYPLYEMDLEFPLLTQADFHSIVGFYNQQGSSFLPFYLSADNDNSVTEQQFATLDGTTKTFQLTKPDSTYWSEPVGGVNGIPSIYANGTQVFQTGTGTPANPVLGQISGGTKSARTYYVRIQYFDALTNSSAASSEASISVGANSLLTVNSPGAAPGATSYLIFISTSSNAETLAASLPIGTNYTEPTGTVPSGLGYSSTDYTPYSVTQSGWITFTGAGAPGVAMTWTGNYYYLVRFKPDLETDQFMAQLYNAKTVTVRTAR